jgi:hypothetical protein
LLERTRTRLEERLADLRQVPEPPR